MEISKLRNHKDKINYIMDEITRSKNKLEIIFCKKANF